MRGKLIHGATLYWEGKMKKEKLIRKKRKSKNNNRNKEVCFSPSTVTQIADERNILSMNSWESEKKNNPIE
jgi:hypothetical protein